ncbi:MAG: thiamine diphosphokinase [Clostridiales Family XIII bacterium]|jgi:thiamine pyrophosphokinase|nr:thiamine diphosphokinase [Clostridiales Family XIII bacterium]
MTGRCFIVTAGPGFPEAAGLAVGGEDLVLCADGGFAAARAAGLRVDAVIGDMDSIDPALLAEAGAGFLEIVRHPVEKDDTDTLLCAKEGLARGYSDFVILGGIGGDFAHTMANLQALSFLTDMECAACIVAEGGTLFMVDGVTVKAPRPGSPDPADLGAQTHEKVFCGEPGGLFSIFSYAERTSRVTIAGAARYKLTDAVMTQSYPIGVHNAFTAGASDGLGEGEVRVSCGFGRLLVVVEQGGEGSH